MAISMVHWNGDQMAVIDTETTGVDPEIHEIYQFTMVMVDSNFDIRSDVLPLNLWIKPNRPELVKDIGKLKTHKKRIQQACNEGFDSVLAADLVCEYVDKLGLPYTTSGTRKRIIPCGHNYQFDYSFILNWLGPDTYMDIFSVLYRDTMQTALFLNDYAAFHGEKAFANKVNLSFLAGVLGIEHGSLHDSLEDVRVTAEIMKRMCKQAVIARKSG